MYYKIVPKFNIAEIIDADNADDAMAGFAWAMDSDMNMYFMAEPASDEEVKEWEGD